MTFKKFFGPAKKNKLTAIKRPFFNHIWANKDDYPAATRFFFYSMI